MDKNRMVIYQINPRMFTPSGTLAAAEKLLPHVAAAGANVAYLFSICKEDDSKDRAYWSDRQKKSGLSNPKNPYRISDYFAIDEEYGTEEDLKRFVKTAHKLGMYVMIDVVFYHCAPHAKLIEEIPDGVIRDENGEIVYGQWHFPRLNFSCRALRDYLIENLLWFVREFDVDGFRCDVGDWIPLDFWREAVDALRAVKKDVVMLNEGNAPEHVTSGVFDLNYNWPALIWAQGALAPFIREGHGKIEALKIGRKGIYFMENHDTVTDNGRAETAFSSEVCDCLYVYLFTADGTPLLYCGEEIADANAHSMFANKDHNRGYGVDWSSALLPAGKRRLALVKKLSALRKGEDAFALGDFVFTDGGSGDLLSYARRYRGERVDVFINFGKRSAAVNAGGEILLARGLRRRDGKIFLAANGFLITKK